ALFLGGALLLLRAGALGGRLPRLRLPPVQGLLRFAIAVSRGVLLQILQAASHALGPRLKDGGVALEERLHLRERLLQAALLHGFEPLGARLLTSREGGGGRCRGSRGLRAFLAFQGTRLRGIVG